MNQKKSPGQTLKVPPVATIPWVPVKIDEKKPLEQTNYFKNSKCTGENRKRMRRFQQLMDRIFPFYLPKRYHTMDCKKLKNKSTSSGQYWANASYFFMVNQLHGQRFWGACMTEADTNKNHVTLKPLISPSTKLALFGDGGLEQCESAADFLLEPWVLIQLPFQPVVLHQWLVALMVETYKFKTEMADFRQMPYTSGVSAVDDLIRLDSSLQEAIINGFVLLFVSSFEKNNIPDTKKCEKIKSIFFKGLLPIIPLLEFILSGNAVNTIRAAKRCVWNKNTLHDQQETRMTPDLYVLSKTNYLYSYDFLNRGKAVDLFRSEIDKEMDRPEFSTDADQAWFDKIKQKYGATANWTDIVKFVDEMIIKPGRIKGVSRETIVKETRGDLLVLYFYNQYMKHKETCSSSSGVAKQDAGIYYCILTCTSDFFMADAIAAITSRLYYKLEMGPDAKELGAYLDADLVTSVPHAKLKIANNAAIKRVKNNKLWTLAKLMEKLKNSIGSKVITCETCPDLDKLKIEEVATIFEARIKSVLLQMIERQYETLTGTTIKLYPEIQFVQYILPCFVASLLELAEEPSDTRLLDTKRYALFIHELIKSFESPENLADTTDTFLPFDLTAYNGLNGSDKILINAKIDTIMAYIGSQTQIGQNILNKFLKVMTSLYNVENYSKALGLAPTNYLVWTGQLAKYLSRIQYAFRKSSSNPIDHLHDRLFSAYSFCRLTREFVTDIYFLCQKEDAFMVTDVLMKLIDIRLCKLLGRPEMCAQVGCVTGDNSKSMSIQQMLAIVIYHTLSIVLDPELKQKGTKLYESPFRLDSASVAFSHYLSNDTWRLKQIISTWLNDPNDIATDPSLACFRFALHVSPVFYLRALVDLKRKPNANQLEKVRFARCGEITFYPVKHCRWCGLLEQEADSFRLCKECLENPEFPDKNFFCSDGCETKALDDEHTEDHARFLLIKLGII